MTDIIEVQKRINLLKEQILQTEKVLAESRENLNQNQDSYSAKLLLVSTENYLNDLLIELHNEHSKTANLDSVNKSSGIQIDP